jgi:hypothetical protein
MSITTTPASQGGDAPPLLSLPDCCRTLLPRDRGRERDHERDMHVSALVRLFCASSSPPDSTWSVRHERRGRWRRMVASPAEPAEPGGQSLDIWYGRRWAMVVQASDVQRQVFPCLDIATRHITAVAAAATAAASSSLM